MYIYFRVTQSVDVKDSVEYSKLTAYKRVRVETPEPNPKSRWRQKNESTYSRIKRKTRRNLGHEYFSDKTKKLVPARILGSPCGCKNKCREKLGGVEIKFFDEFWNLGSWDLQNSYLFGCVNIVQKKRSYRHKQTKK